MKPSLIPNWLAAKARQLLIPALHAPEGCLGPFSGRPVRSGARMSIGLELSRESGHPRTGKIGGDRSFRPSTEGPRSRHTVYGPSGHARARLSRRKHFAFACYEPR
jgi:hypothetical protein